MASTSPIFKNHKILKLKDIYTFQISKIMYKIDRKQWLGKFNLIKTNQFTHITLEQQMLEIFLLIRIKLKTPLLLSLDQRFGF